MLHRSHAIHFCVAPCFALLQDTFWHLLHLSFLQLLIAVLVLLSVVEGCRNSTPLAPAGKRFFLVLTKVTLFKKNNTKISNQINDLLHSWAWPQ